MLERNYQVEGMMPRGSNRQWWSESFKFFGIHVFTQNEGWSWKVNSITESKSKNTYATKEDAYNAAKDFVRQQLVVIMNNI